MNEDIIGRISKSAKFDALVKEKMRFSWQLTFVMLVIYYGFILLIAFAPSWLGKPLWAGAMTTIGIPLGIVVILSALVLTGIYVRRANNEFDRITQEVIEEAKS